MILADLDGFIGFLGGFARLDKSPESSILQVVDMSYMVRTTCEGEKETYYQLDAMRNSP